APTPAVQVASNREPRCARTRPPKNSAPTATALSSPSRLRYDARTPSPILPLWRQIPARPKSPKGGWNTYNPSSSVAVGDWKAGASHAWAAVGAGLTASTAAAQITSVAVTSTFRRTVIGLSLRKAHHRLAGRADSTRCGRLHPGPTVRSGARPRADPAPGRTIGADSRGPPCHDQSRRAGDDAKIWPLSRPQ